MLYAQKLELWTIKGRTPKFNVYCPKCNEFLCMGACFEHYHTLVNFKL